MKDQGGSSLPVEEGGPEPDGVNLLLKVLSACAGFCGAVPFGFYLWVPLTWVLQPAQRTMQPEEVLYALATLIPFAAALFWVNRRDWVWIAILIPAGLGVGLCTIVLSWLAFIVLLPTAAVGLVLGLVLVFPCWWRGNSAGLAMAFLGIAPSAAAFVIKLGEARLETVLAVLILYAVSIGLAIIPRPTASKPKPDKWGDRDPLE